MKRQDTLRTRDILQSMKSHGFDNVDEMGFDSVSTKSYFFYLRHMGIVSFNVAMMGYILSQGFDVWSRIWLADWTAKEARPDEVSTKKSGSHSSMIF